jgi:hypothetical protein
MAYLLLVNVEATGTSAAWPQSYCRRWMGAPRWTSSLNSRKRGPGPRTSAGPHESKENVMYIGGGLLLLILIILLLVILF